MSELSLKRGDIVVLVVRSDYGKQRLGVVVQSDLFNETHSSVVLCPLSSELTGLGLFRIALPADTVSGLKKPSEVMVDKLAAIRRDRISQRIGRLGRGDMVRVDEALGRWLSLTR